MSTLKAVCLSRDLELASEVASALAALPGFAVVAKEADLQTGLDVVRAVAPELVVVVLPEDDGAGVAVIEEARRSAPGAHVVALAPDEAPETIIRVIRAGADEVLPMPVTTTALLKICIKVTEVRKTVAPQAGPQGEVWVVHGPKGGVGSTAVAANLGLAVRARGRGCALVDLDTYAGDLALHLNLTPTYTLLDIAEDVKRLDSLFLQGTMTRHESGAELLAAPANQTGLQPFDLPADDTGVILDLLSRMHEVTIVDTCAIPTPAVRAAATRADRFLLVADLTLPAVRACLRTLEWLRMENVDTARVELVVNQHGRLAGELPPDEVSKTLKLPIRATIPRDAAVAITAVNHGQPWRDVPKGQPLWDAVVGLLPADAEQAEGRRSGLLRFFAGRKGK